MMVRCDSRAKYDELVVKFSHQAPELLSYFQRNWENIPEMWAGYGRSGVFHLDNHTTNRLEKFHATIKSILTSSKIKMGAMIEKLLSIITVRSIIILSLEIIVHIS